MYHETGGGEDVDFILLVMDETIPTIIFYNPLP